MLLLASCAVAAQQDEGTRTTGEAKNDTPAERRKPVEPATTFTPSEKIKADSAVSFPVDI